MWVNVSTFYIKGTNPQWGTVRLSQVFEGWRVLSSLISMVTVRFHPYVAGGHIHRLDTAGSICIYIIFIIVILRDLT